MLYIESVDGCSYLINKESISIVKSHGSNVMIFFKNSDEHIIGKMNIEDVMKFYKLSPLKNSSS